MNEMWFSFLLGGLIKSVMVRYGGRAMKSVSAPLGNDSRGIRVACIGVPG